MPGSRFGIVLILFTLLLGSVLFTGRARAATPPYEPDTFTENGTLTFYDGSGSVITQGDATQLVPWIAADGQEPQSVFDGSVTLIGALPEPGQAPSAFLSTPMTSTRPYPVSGAPGLLATTHDAVIQPQAGEFTFGNLPAQLPHSAGDVGTAFDGLYQIRLLTNGSGGADTKDWAADIVLSGSGCATNVAPCSWTQTYPTGLQGTTSQLVVTPGSPQGLGTTLTFTATITPSTVTGTVQFQDGATAIGAPVAVSGGSAVLSYAGLAAGTHSLTALFQPSSPGTVASSLSPAVPFVVNAAGSAPTISTSSLPSGMVSVAYTATLAASGGAGPYSWAVSAGALPAGITLGSSSGVLSGTPTAAGSFSFTVQLTDSSSPAKTASQPLVLVINPPTPPPVITTTTLPTGTVNAAYSAQLAATSGTPPYTWAITAGSLPGGVTGFNTSTGAISGTPQVAGTFPITFMLTDHSLPTPQTATKTLSITINPQPLRATIVTPSLPTGTVGTPYAGMLQAEGGTSPYTWSHIGGLPPGLSLSSSTGAISGTPTAAGAFSVEFVVTDSSTPAQSGAADFAITINPASSAAGGPLQITTSSLQNGVVSAPYSFTLGATGGSAPYFWTISSGTLPAGLTLGAQSGVISGTPTSAGTSSFSVQASDSTTPTPQTATQALTLTVAAAGAPSTATLTVSSQVVAFGNQAVGTTSRERLIKVTAHGTPVAVAKVSVLSILQGGDFSVVNDACTGAMLTPAGSCTFGLRFKPATLGPRVGFVAVTDSTGTIGAGLVVGGVGSTTAGYWLNAGGGGVYAYGAAPYQGGVASLKSHQPVVGFAATPDGAGYWQVATDGGVFAFGDAGYFGSMGGKPLGSPIVGMAATNDGGGYWLVAKDGGIFAFGDAPFLGSLGGKPLNAPIVGMAATNDGGGYWLVAKDGGIFAYGDAAFLGSMGGKPLNGTVVGMAAEPDGSGYWLVGADGGLFAFGAAKFHGSTASQHLNQPIVAMASTDDGLGYWLTAKDGGIFAFGTAGFFGSAASAPVNGGVVGITPAG